MLKFDDGKELDQAVFNFGETEMLFIKNAGSREQIEFVLRGLGPRKIDDPIKIVAADGVFGNGRRDMLKSL
jgi:hypothetical protein